MASYNTLKRREMDTRTEERLAIREQTTRRGGLAGVGSSDDRRTRRGRLAKAKIEHRHMIRDAGIKKLKEERKAKAEAEMIAKAPVQHAIDKMILEDLAKQDEQAKESANE